MNPIATCAAHFLEAHPHPALRLGELLAPVADRVDRSLTVDRLRQALAEHPDAFRILDPWKGPWRAQGAVDDPSISDVWVVLINRPTPTTLPMDEPAATLRETVRWLARGIDERSRLSVSRWYAMALTERETRRAMAQRAA